MHFLLADMFLGGDFDLEWLVILVVLANSSFVKNDQGALRLILGAFLLLEI